MDLVIMAAGMGSRFGGLKQIEPIDENNNFLIDYSIYDAIRAGFDRVVFIIKEENKEIFEETVGNRIKKKIKVEYVFQKGIKEFERQKPWGTAHAILACKNVVKDNFATINADDFYGKEAFLDIANKLKTLDESETNYLLVGYKAKNTISENGATKRGVAEVENGLLKFLTESSLEMKNGKLYATPLGSTETKIIDQNSLVSMNMFGFTPSLFKFLEKGFEKFLNENQNNLEKCEYLLPEIVAKLIKENKINVSVINTNAVWHGVTYKEDKPKVVNSIKKLINNGDYPKNLWEKN
ncbi:MAG: nucleotidyltransferase [Clostridia bacterium]|nr:nucleotidyltransferase [Clostridia bacterium]